MYRSAQFRNNAVLGSSARFGTHPEPRASVNQFRQQCGIIADWHRLIVGVVKHVLNVRIHTVEYSVGTLLRKWR